ncbi:hypothetical protein BD414DRAFT_130736 [Trametes punicea]|nr:hypothetical protein BD414DRAFT_130736 [Trametes punicea]
MKTLILLVLAKLSVDARRRVLHAMSRPPTIAHASPSGKHRRIAGSSLPLLVREHRMVCPTFLCPTTSHADGMDVGENAGFQTVPKRLLERVTGLRVTVTRWAVMRTRGRHPGGSK